MDLQDVRWVYVVQVLTWVVEKDYSTEKSVRNRVNGQREGLGSEFNPQ